MYSDLLLVGCLLRWLRFEWMKGYIVTRGYSSRVVSVTCVCAHFACARRVALFLFTCHFCEEVLLMSGIQEGG